VGADFCALLKHPGPDVIRPLMREWETASPPEFSPVPRLLREQGFISPRLADGNRWTDPETLRQTKRITAPDVSVCLDTVEGFSIFFGAEAVMLYHTLRWRFFLTDPEWQRVMLAATRAVGERLGTGAAVLASDCHPIMTRFRERAAWRKCFADLPEGFGEVKSFGKLYIKVSSPAWHDGRRLRTSDTAWDSRGFWRYVFGVNEPVRPDQT
jgi:hypothetical protein